MSHCRALCLLRLAVLQGEKARSGSLSEDLAAAQARAAQAELDARAAQAACDEARRMFSMLLQVQWGCLLSPRGLAGWHAVGLPAC